VVGGGGAPWNAVRVAKTTRQLTHYTDDITGEPFTDGEGKTIAFAYEGTSYEIDLSTANATELDTLVGSYVDHARKVGGRSAGGRGRRGAAPRADSVAAAVDSSAVWAWAKEQGLTGSERGRVGASVIEAYTAAH